MAGAGSTYCGDLAIRVLPANTQCMSTTPGCANHDIKAEFLPGWVAHSCEARVACITALAGAPAGILQVLQDRSTLRDQVVTKECKGGTTVRTRAHDCSHTLATTQPHTASPQQHHSAGVPTKYRNWEAWAVAEALLMLMQYHQPTLQVMTQPCPAPTGQGLSGYTGVTNSSRLSTLLAHIRCLLG